MILRATTQCVLLVALTACEMFVGDFVEDEETTDPVGPDPSTPVSCQTPFRCRGGNLEACTIRNGKQDFKVEEVCGSQEKCDAADGQCLTCVPYEFTCQDNTVQQCDAAGEVRESIAECAADTKCDVTTGKCEMCLVGETRCGSNDEGAITEQCQVIANTRGWIATACGSYACLTDAETGENYCQACETVGEAGCVETAGSMPSKVRRECTSDFRWSITPCPGDSICENGTCVAE